MDAIQAVIARRGTWILIVLLALVSATFAAPGRPGRSVNQIELFHPREHLEPHGKESGRTSSGPGSAETVSPRQRIELELGKAEPNLALVREALEAKYWSASELVGLANKAGPDTKLEPLDPAHPNVLVRTPENKVADLVTQTIIANHFKPALARRVDRDSFILMALPQSSVAENIVANEIPSFRIAGSGMVGKIARGELEATDIMMFSSLQGKTLFVVGHVEIVSGKPAFEIRRTDGSSLYLSIDLLREAAKVLRFNFIPLGCETAETLALGTATQISDVDGLRAFQRAVSRSGEVPYETLLGEISDSNLTLILNPLRSLEFDVIAVEVVDRQAKLTTRAAFRTRSAREALRAAADSSLT